MDGIRRRIVPIGLLYCVVMSGSVSNSQAVSFDCAKAATTVEKAICADEELSKLDEEMAAAYVKALPKAPDSELLKKQQKQWLYERNRCREKNCLNEQYQLRIGELQRVLALVPLVDTQESHLFTSEAEKLKVMRDVVRRQDFVWYNPYEQAPAYCMEFKQDFIAGRNLEAVEPDFRTNDPNDPRLAKLNRCTDPNAQPDDETVTEFLGVEFIGGPPYRYYSIELDSDPNDGKEDIVYSEETETALGTGYSWIDASECVVKGGASQMTRWSDTPRYLYRFTTLAKYKGDLIMVGITSTPGNRDPTLYDFRMWSFGNTQQILECSFNPD